jgi:hypothetical protein
MSAKTHRRSHFLSEHPLCCFCGGQTPSAEPDHIPSRVFFDDRQWPEGYIFPACVQCNRISRHDEQVVALLSRLYSEAQTEIREKEFQERVRAVAYNYPEVIQEMKLSARQARNAIKKYNWRLAPGMTSADLPVIFAGGPLVNTAVTTFGRKLFCALYYKHTRQILPMAGGIAIKWFTNLQVENGALPRELAELLRGMPELVRSNNSLNNQFFYRYVVSDCGGLASFLVFFRQSFAMLGYVKSDAEDFEPPYLDSVHFPFHHI